MMTDDDERRLAEIGADKRADDCGFVYRLLLEAQAERDRGLD